MLERRKIMEIPSKLFPPRIDGEAEDDADAGRKPALKRKAENAAEKLSRKGSGKKEEVGGKYVRKYVRGYGPVIIPRSKEEFDELVREDQEKSHKAEEEAKTRYLEAIKQAEESKKNKVANLRKIGFVFSPSDEVLVNYYLKNRTLGTLLDLCPIDDVEVYANHPRTLTEKFTPNGGLWYFFTKSRPNENTDVEGQWVVGEKNDVFDNGVKVGVRQELLFNGEGVPNGNGKYKITEYQLDSLMSAPLFVCKLYNGV